MAHHAYLFAGDLEEGIAASRAYAEAELGFPSGANPDIIVARHGLFSVDDARQAGMFAAQSAVAGNGKLMVIAATRLFHEAQNALLKLFEEPPEGTTLVLVVPAEGLLLPTLRSRLLALPNQGLRKSPDADSATGAFLSAGKDARAKMLAKLVERAKSDKEGEKQAARAEAITLAEGLIRAAYAARKEASGAARHGLGLFLADLDRFMPILHERSAPLKLIFEHLLLTIPEGLSG